MNSLGTLTGEGQVGGEGAPLVKRGTRVCLVPLASPQAAGGRELTLTPSRPQTRRCPRGRERPCQAGDILPPSLWLAGVCPRLRNTAPASVAQLGEPGSERLPTGPGHSLPTPSPWSFAAGHLGSPSTHPWVQGEGTPPLSVTSWVPAVAAVHPESGLSRSQTTEPGCVGLPNPHAPLSLGPWPRVATSMPTPLGLSLPAGRFWLAGLEPQGWPCGPPYQAAAPPPPATAPGLSKASPGSPRARPASGTARGQSGDPGPAWASDPWLREVGARLAPLLAS